MMNENEAELCGMIIGDGWIQRNKKGLFMSGDPIEDKEYYEKRVVQLFKTFLKRSIKARNFEYWKTYGIGIYRKKEIKKFIEMDIPIGKKGTEIIIPKEIMKSNVNVQKAFLRGLFDTDGTIYPMKQKERYSRARLRIASISKRLIDDVKLISRKIGVHHSNPSPSNARGKRVPNKSYIFEINKINDIRKWFTMIKPKNPKHITKFKLWKTIGIIPPKTTIEERYKMLSHLAILKTVG